MANLITAVTEATYDQEVTNSERPVLIDFWAPWCGPCMALMPVIEAVAPSYEDKLKIVKINVDENPGLQAKFGVQGIPAVFLMQGDRKVATIKGRTRTRLSLELDELLA